MKPQLVHAVVVGEEPHEGCDVCDARAEAERLREVLRDIHEMLGGGEWDIYPEVVRAVEIARAAFDEDRDA